MTKTILVLHYAAQYPVPGMAFQILNHILVLSELGYNVYLVQDSNLWPYNPKRTEGKNRHLYGISFTKKFMKKFGFGNKWVYSDIHNNLCYGLSQERLMELYGEADAILNISAITGLRDEHLKCPIRVYIETDPIGAQIKYANGDRNSIKQLRAHTHHFTYGENLGNQDCPIPLPKEFDWQKTRPPCR